MPQKAMHDLVPAPASHFGILSSDLSYHLFTTPSNFRVQPDRATSGLHMLLFKALTPLNRVGQDTKCTGTRGSVRETCAGRSSSRDHSLDEVTCMNPQCLQMERQQGSGGFPGREPSSPGNRLCCGQHHRRGPLRVGPHVGSQVHSSSLTLLDQAEGRRSDCG